MLSHGIASFRTASLKKLHPQPEDRIHVPRTLRAEILLFALIRTTNRYMTIDKLHL